MLALALAHPAAAQDQSIVVNPLTGVAIEGYDPVAYFTDGEARPGSAEYVYDWAGVPWYFTSAANRDVFAGDPAVYAPLFGGHGGMAMARGYLSDGNPQIFRIVAERLVLFYSVGNREAFDIAGPRTLARALENWDALTPLRLPAEPEPTPEPETDPEP